MWLSGRACPRPCVQFPVPQIQMEMLYHAHLRHSSNRMSPVAQQVPICSLCFLSIVDSFPTKEMRGRKLVHSYWCLGRGGLPRCGGCYLRQMLVARTLLPSWGTEERPLWVSSQESAPLVLWPRAGEIWTCSGTGELSREARALKEPLRQQSTQKRLTERNLQQNLCKLVCRAGLCCTHKPACWLKRGS